MSGRPVIVVLAGVDGAGKTIPAPRLVLALNSHRVTVPDRRDAIVLADVPTWAKAIVQAAFGVRP